EHFQMFRSLVLRFAEVPGNGAAESFVDAERNGAAADAVDAEHKVKNRAKHRQQPDESNPERRGAGIAFVEQGMSRGEQGGQKIETRSQVRPEPGDLVEPVHYSPFFMTKARRDASAVLESFVLIPILILILLLIIIIEQGGLGLRVRLRLRLR